MNTKQPASSKSCDSSLDNEERNQLTLLREVQLLLSKSLNSLGGKDTLSPATTYLVWTSVSINRVVEGFLLLREAGLIPASRLMVRPVIEMMFAGIAATRDQDFLFRKAYSEWEEDLKLFATDGQKQKEAETALQSLEQAFSEHFPKAKFPRKKVSVRETAGISGKPELYDTYRLYCQFTHGALRTMQVEMGNPSDARDTPLMVWCVLQILDHLKANLIAEIPDLVPFKKRLMDWHQESNAAAK